MGPQIHMLDLENLYLESGQESAPLGFGKIGQGMKKKGRRWPQSMGSNYQQGSSQC